MWILLRVKLPTNPSPPKLSIHWSRADTSDNAHAQDQAAMLQKLAAEQHLARGDGYLPRVDDEVFYLDAAERGAEPNWLRARWITYQGVSLRVFPHEYSPVTLDNMRLYVFGTEAFAGSHELLPDTPADAQLIDGVLDGDQRLIYDAALVDGATEAQAKLTALGMDVLAVEFPPIGWYRARDAYAALLCEPWECAG